MSIERLLGDAVHRHLALEWWTVEEWLGSPTLILVTDSQERPVGLVLTIVGDGPVAWVRAIFVSSDSYLVPLLEASAEAVMVQGRKGLALLGDEGWLVTKLRQAGFRIVNHVVTLRSRGSWPMGLGPPDLRVGTATAADVEPILAVDHAAFAPMWWYSRDIFNRALDLAHTFEVAYLRDECVGYQLSTLQSNRGHIVRLAVHPRWQRHGIGGRLLSGAIRALVEAQAEVVTVNTQEDNRASLQLYYRFSFDRAGKPWTVWFRSLE